MNNLLRWEPFTASEGLISRLAPELFGRWPHLPLPSALESKMEWSPSANISETDKEYLIRAELPAVKKEDVRVSVQDNIVTIAGERKQHQEQKTEKIHRVESYWGSFSRSFALPDNVNADAIHCESKDGVLTVHMPKIEKATPKAKQIKVE
jgi:HSP20 family protein